jgi:hypothetical protein
MSYRNLENLTIYTAASSNTREALDSFLAKSEVSARTLFVQIVHELSFEWDGRNMLDELVRVGRAAGKDLESHPFGVLTAFSSYVTGCGGDGHQNRQLPESRVR